MNFELNKSIELLQRSPQTYKSLFYGMNSNWGYLNEGKDTWSAFDIIGHLIHGEITDWIPRAKIILSKQLKDKTFEPFDMLAHKQICQSKTMENLLEEFEKLRNNNIKELKSWNLSEEELNMTGIHPEQGEVSLKQLISTWAIHDYGHLNQISRVIVKHHTEDVGPFKNFYTLLR